MKHLINFIVIISTIYLSGCEDVDDIANGPFPEALTGCWKETVTSETIDNEKINELRFDDDGFFSVTWHPFETYMDYWGTYEYNSDTGSLNMFVDDGNHIPETIDTAGHAQTNINNELILLNTYLGASYNATQNNKNNRPYTFSKFSESCVGSNPVPAPDPDPEPVPALTSSLTLLPSSYAQGETIAFSLTIHNPTDDAITVFFSTAQQYDFYIESDGNEIWRWSNGFAFAQAFSEFFIPAHSSVLINQTWNQILSNGNNIPIGNYTIYGSLLNQSQVSHYDFTIE